MKILKNLANPFYYFVDLLNRTSILCLQPFRLKGTGANLQHP